MSVAGPTRGDEHKADQKHRPTGLERVTVRRGALTSTGLEPELDQRFRVKTYQRTENTMASGDHCRFGTGPTGSPDGTVIHFDCDDYGDNTMTDLYTGAILRYRPKHWVVTENA